MRAIPGVKVGDELALHIPLEAGDENPGAKDAKPIEVSQDIKTDDKDVIKGLCSYAIHITQFRSCDTYY